MKQIFYPAIFLLALIQRFAHFPWFILVALGFFLYGFVLVAAEGGGCYRCKLALGAGVLLVIIGLGAAWLPLYGATGAMLGIAAFT